MERLKRALDAIPELEANPDRTDSAEFEKFEEYSQVGFAVVLLTPEDVGSLANEEDSQLRPRARQNVVLELGFFIGNLGRDRTCALRVGDVETPSDYDGVLYTPMDEQGAWRMDLVGELKAAGFSVDANLVFRG